MGELSFLVQWLIIAAVATLVYLAGYAHGRGSRRNDRRKEG